MATVEGNRADGKVDVNVEKRMNARKLRNPKVRDPKMMVSVLNRRVESYLKQQYPPVKMKVMMIGLKLRAEMKMKVERRREGYHLARILPGLEVGLNPDLGLGQKVVLDPGQGPDLRASHGLKADPDQDQGLNPGKLITCILL